MSLTWSVRVSLVILAIPFTTKFRLPLTGNVPTASELLQYSFGGLKISCLQKGSHKRSASRKKTGGTGCIRLIRCLETGKRLTINAIQARTPSRTFDTCVIDWHRGQGLQCLSPRVFGNRMPASWQGSSHIGLVKVVEEISPICSQFSCKNQLYEN